MEFAFEDKYDDVEKIPAQFRPLYNPTDGGFALDAEKFGGIREAVTGLNKALKASRNEAKTYKSKTLDLGKLAEFGETPDGILEAFQAKLAQATEAAKATGNEDVKRQLDKLRAELTQASEKTVKVKDEAIGGLRSQLEDVLGRQVALSALAGKALDPDLAMPFVLRQLRPVEKDGKFRMVVVDSDGDPRVDPVTQQEVTVAQLVEEMRADKKYAPLFRAEERSGGGKDSTRRPAAARIENPARQLSSVEKIQAGLRKGQAKHSSTR